MDGKIGVIS